MILKKINTLFLWMIFCTFLHSCAVTEKSKNELKSELTAILNSDQELRELAQEQKITPERKKELLTKYHINSDDYPKNLWKIIENKDSTNLIKIEKIIKKYGYPGKSLVGSPLNEATFYVIQHSKLQVMEKYFPIIEKAGNDGEIEKTKVAMMHDRLLMYNNKEQIYGTQIAGRIFIDPETKKEEWKNFLWPVKNPEEINKLRKETGFKETIEEYVKYFGVDYNQKYTIEQIEKTTKKITSQ